MRHRELKLGEMDRFMSHCDKHFKQGDCLVIHPTDDRTPHIDVLVYEPNEKYPFWKLVTMGASSQRMPSSPNTIGNRNEYMMFIDPSENLHDQNVVGWYYKTLLSVAWYPIESQCHITCGHSVEWGEEEGSDMVCAFIEMPQIIEEVSFLRCKLGLLKEIVCLQVVLLTRAETERLLEIGPEKFSEFLYPEEGTAHYLCEKKRTERF
ncbi:MAG: suppressor of fused domain protein [Lachnospiraceae bacterium]|nr:suppressor of fused domain protein [Robinsoniella sp.]MDY3766731.1 suppressor of fused domain protein [Lachnospiraceae bacterium]